MKWYTITQLGQHTALTPEGYLLAKDVAIARTGVQMYHASEVPIEPNRDGFIAVERPAEEVFAPESIASFHGKPIVDDHPMEDVTPHNWRTLALGHVMNPRRGTGANDDVLLADLLITTDEGIRAIRGGKRQVSVGYDAFYDQTSAGHGVQRKIVCNHLALVDQGRCGTRCTILDSGAAIYNPLWLDTQPYNDGAGTWEDQMVSSIPGPAQPAGGVSGWQGVPLEGDPAYLRPGENDDLDWSEEDDLDWAEDAEFDPAAHPHAPAGASGGHGGEFVKKGEGGAGGGGSEAPKEKPKSQTWNHQSDDPPQLNGVDFAPWDAPSGWNAQEEWESDADENRELFSEPPMKSIPGKKPSAGVIIKEPDGRIWIMHPRGHYAGYNATFPKGGIDPGMSPQATAVKEAYEETGLHVRLTGFAGDVERPGSMARYYYAERIGGTPTDHGWEAHKVGLYQPEDLDKELNVSVDKKIAKQFVMGEKPAAQAPSAPAAAPSPSGGLDVSKMKKVGGSQGTTPGGVYEHEDGKRYYVKKQETVRAKNEMLAAALAKAVGLKTFNYQMLSDGTGSASEMLPKDHPDSVAKEGTAALSAEDRKKVNQDFAIHAWLANWDVAGAGSEHPEMNMGMTKSGEPISLDWGGALNLTGLGKPKGSKFGNQVGEIDSLRDGKINPTAAKLFKDITPKEIKQSAIRLKQVSDDQVHQLVGNLGSGTYAERTALATKLIARKRDILKAVAQIADRMPWRVIWHQYRHAA